MRYASEQPGRGGINWVQTIVKTILISPTRKRQVHLPVDEIRHKNLRHWLLAQGAALCHRRKELRHDCSRLRPFISIEAQSVIWTAYIVRVNDWDEPFWAVTSFPPHSLDDTWA